MNSVRSVSDDRQVAVIDAPAMSMRSSRWWGRLARWTRAHQSTSQMQEHGQPGKCHGLSVGGV
jgi:hypothetical protein